MLTPLQLVRVSCAFAALASLNVMWAVTDFAHNLEDVAVLFYAVLAIAPYGLAARMTATGYNAPAEAWLFLLGTIVISALGLFAYYHAFFAFPNDHNGFAFLYVPIAQGLGFIGLNQLLQA